jgi:hypothetical protein
MVRLVNHSALSASKAYIYGIGVNPKPSFIECTASGWLRGTLLCTLFLNKIPFVYLIFKKHGCKPVTVRGTGEL